MPFRLGLPELALILVIVLLIFGAGRLPEIGSAMGKAIRSFKSSSAGEEDPKPAPKSKRGKAKAEPGAEAKTKEPARTK